MKGLPIEIVNTIFLQLTLDQKLECFQVCRKWSQVLRSGCLLDTVDLYGIDKIEAFFEFLNDNPHRERQIKHVVLSNNYEADFDIGNLCLYFPKLSTMCLTQARPYSIVYRFSPDPDMAGLGDLRNSITKMIDFGYCNYMEQLLLSGLCQRLTSLTLDLYYVDLLENAPNVLHLTVAHFSSDIATLELLSTYLNQLETLVLDNVEFITEPHVFINVSPSLSLKKISFGVVNIVFDRQLVLLDYIKRKYTRLVSFDRYEPRADEWNLRETLRFTATCIIPFTRYYGQQMKSMRLESLAEEPNLFVILDELDCKLHSFSVDTFWSINSFRIITASNQCKFIQELSLKNYDVFEDGDLEYPNAPFEQLDKFVSLRKLTFNYYTSYVDYRARISLNDLLDSCSNTLESLTIEDATLTFNQNPNQSQEQYNLCKLQLYGADVPNEFGYFLSRYCQKLTHIKLTGYEPFITTIDIPTTHLSCFDMESPTSKDALDLSVSTIADGRQRYYSTDHTHEWRGFLDELIDEHGTSVCNTVSTVPVPTNSPFKLICSSVDTIIINHFLAR